MRMKTMTGVHVLKVKMMTGQNCLLTLHAREEAEYFNCLAGRKPNWRLLVPYISAMSLMVIGHSLLY
jgi:hypothetical protein